MPSRKHNFLVPALTLFLVGLALACFGAAQAAPVSGTTQKATRNATRGAAKKTVQNATRSAAPEANHEAASQETAAQKAAAETARAFFAYLLTPGANITEDQAARERWLSKNLRTLLLDADRAVAKARLVPGVEGPDPAPPYNATFLDSWDPPSRCDVTPLSASFRYTQVKVTCDWGKETNYPDTSRTGIAWLAEEDGGWRLFALHWFSTEFAQASDVGWSLVTLRTEAEALTDGKEAPEWSTLGLPPPGLSELTLAACGKARLELKEKPDSCPCCGFSPVADIMYGLPRFSKELDKALAAGTIALGGCVITDDDPKWRCSRCGAVFYKKQGL